MSKNFVTIILLAAGLAASKPILDPYALQPLTLRQVQPAEVDTSPNPGLLIVSALAAVESEAKKEVVQVNIENLNIFNIDRDGKENSVQDKAKNNARAAPKAEEDAAVQALMLEKVNEALVIDQQANAANNEVDNVLRAMAMSQKEQDKSTVILVVTKIEIKVEVNIDLDDDKNGKKKVDASMFMQEAVVANRGKAETETVMVYSPRTLTAADVAAGLAATPTAAADAKKPAEAAATKTVDAVLYNAKPTHTAVAEDPAAAMRAALEDALEDRQKKENRAKDVEVNIDIALVIVKIEKDNGAKDLQDDVEDDADLKQEQALKDVEQAQKDAAQKQADADQKVAEKKAQQLQDLEQAQQDQDQAAKDAEQKAQEKAEFKAEKAEAAQEAKAEQKAEAAEKAEAKQKATNKADDNTVKITLSQ